MRHVGGRGNRNRNILRRFGLVWASNSASVCGSRRGFYGVVRQHDGLRLDLQAAVLGKHVELMDPVAVRIAIRRAARTRRSGEAEGQATLLLIVDRAAAGLRYSFPKPGRRKEIRLYEEAGSGSCHHRVVEVGSGDVIADRSAHAQ